MVRMELKMKAWKLFDYDGKHLRDWNLSTGRFKFGKNNWSCKADHYNCCDAFHFFKTKKEAVAYNNEMSANSFSQGQLVVVPITVHGKVKECMDGALTCKSFTVEKSARKYKVKCGWSNYKREVNYISGYGPVRRK